MSTSCPALPPETIDKPRSASFSADGQLMISCVRRRQAKLFGGFASGSASQRTMWPSSVVSDLRNFLRDRNGIERSATLMVFPAVIRWASRPISFPPQIDARAFRFRSSRVPAAIAKQPRCWAALRRENSVRWKATVSGFGC